MLWLAGFLALAGPAEVPAQARWPDERAAGPFLCHADFSLAAHENLLQELAALQRDLVRTLGVQLTREPIHLFLFAQKRTYDAYLGHYFPDVPSRRALYIKERGPGMVFAFRSADDFEIDVRHEGTHALLHADLAMVPLWLDEGLAEYFELPADQRTHGHRHLKDMKWQLSKMNFVARIKPAQSSLERLEDLHELNQMGANEYRQAWSWVHFMLHGSEAAHDELLRYLADIRAQTPPGRLGERLRRRIPDLEEQWAEHLRSWKPVP